MSSLSKSALSALVAAMFAFATPLQAALVTFDFEDYAIGNYGPDWCIPTDNCVSTQGALVDKGFVLDPGDIDWPSDADGWIGHYHIYQTSESQPQDRTKFFLFDYFLDESRLHIYAEHGARFGVKHLDLALMDSMSVCSSQNTPPNYNCGVTFIGIFSDGDTLLKSVTLSDVYDGSPWRASEFERFEFGDQWNNLIRLSIVPSHGYLNPSLDNLVLRIVPEPAGLGVCSLLILAAMVRIRQQRRRLAMSPR